MHDGDAVGTVELSREGLYCHLLCRCRMGDGKIHRLYADGEKIGILMPEGEELVLETKVAAKRLKPECTFFLDEKRRTFRPIHPGESFAYLDKVRLGKLAFRDGEPGMFLEG